MVARKHAATTVQPQPPSGGLAAAGTLLPPSSVSSLLPLAVMAPAGPGSDQGTNGALEAGEERERSHNVSERRSEAHPGRSRSR